jgi:hypothetical protein
VNHRERIRAIFNFEKPDRLPVWQLERMTDGASRKWFLEGMPIDENVSDYLGLDRPIRLRVSTEPVPGFVTRTVAEDEETRTIIDVYGGTIQTLRKGRDVSPWFRRHELKGPLSSREDWERYKKLLDPHDPRRFPNTWGPDLFDYCRTAKDPVGLLMDWGPGRGVKGGYGLGVEEFFRIIYDDPAFLEDIFSFWADFLIELLRPVLEAVSLDFFFIEEDGLAYKNSTLISPKTYRALWLPYQRKVTDFVRSHGVRAIGYRTSGNLRPLIPCYLEAGFNMFASLECAAGVDAIELRKKYGRDAILGGTSPARR